MGGPSIWQVASVTKDSVVRSLPVRTETDKTGGYAKKNLRNTSVEVGGVIHEFLIHCSVS